MCGVWYACMTCLDFGLCYTCYLSKEVIHNSDHQFQTRGPEYQTESEQSEPADSESDYVEDDEDYEDEDDEDYEDEDANEDADEDVGKEENKNKDENKEER